MRRFHVVVVAAVLVGLATLLAWSDSWEDRFEAALHMRGANADLWFVHDYAHLIDSYTTVTTAQKYQAVMRMLNAATAGGDIRAGLYGLTANERRSAALIVRRYIQDWRLSQIAEITQRADDLTSGLTQP